MYTHSSIPNYFFNRISALLLVAILTPLLVIRGLIAYLQSGRVFDKYYFAGRHGIKVSKLSFAGTCPGRSLANIFSILSANFDWHGNRPHFYHPESACMEQTIKKIDRLLPDSKLGFMKARPGIVWPERVFAGIGKTNETLVEQQDYPTPVSVTVKLTFSYLVQYILARTLSPVCSVRKQAQVDICGIPIDNLCTNDVLRNFQLTLESGSKQKVAFVNPDCINKAVSDQSYKDTLQQMDCILGDGIGLQLAAKILTVELKENINGTDLFKPLCEMCQQNGTSIFLLGGKPGIAEAMAQNITAEYQSLIIAGTADGYFSHEETESVINTINKSGAGVLLVAFGAPLQECWINQHHDRLNPSIQVGVGGLFDFYSNRIPRAPKWMQASGLEWIWRLIQEPGRMWKRYILGNPLFLYRVYSQSKQDSNRKSIEIYDGKRSSATALIRKYNRYFRRLIYVGTLSGCKRALDIAVSFTMILLLLPLYITVALFVKYTSHGPALFKQHRVGKNGQQFGMYKFRTMYSDAERRKAALQKENEMEGGILFKMKDDPRITPIGKYLRKYSIDELPQLWNVLKGDMSLVGPRPPVPDEVKQYSTADRRRLEIKPGLTCLWQISGRSEVSFKRQVKLDVNYVDSFHPWYDFKILLKTIPAVLSGKGAY